MAETEQSTEALDLLKAENDRLNSEVQRLQQAWPPGHFYSPLPSIESVRARAEAIFDRVPRELPAIDLNEGGQLELLGALERYYAEQPFVDEKTEARRYFFQNPNFTYGEAITLFCMLRHVGPKRVIEIGAGYSSCVILDTNELFFRDSIICTFIEPYPQLFHSLIKEHDSGRINFIENDVQEIPLNIFEELLEGDILFVDSSHVSKTGSDVNFIFFEVLPRLKRGVHVHLHDITYPFEYPREWVYQGRAWNEAYVLRAFLQYNGGFKIRFFNSFLAHFYGDRLKANMPLCGQNPGSSIWLQKV